MPGPAIDPLLPAAALDALRAALGPFTVDAVHAAIGLPGQAALSRGDLAGAARAVRSVDDDRLATLLRLFLLGAEVDEAAARRALDPLPLDTARTAGLLDVSAGSARALLDIRPYAEASVQLPGVGDAPPAVGPWWVVSDFGSDVRPGPLADDHVLGIGAAALTLAQSTPRLPVGRALDIGTGCGVQALHLSRHADAVTATDISVRALRMAATTAALSGVEFTLRSGSLLEPVAGERFDLVVANPPFVVSAGDGGYDYRDSGMSGDAVSRTLVSGLPGILAPGGTAQLLANWIIPTDGDWRDRLGGWLAPGCDAWVWQREVAEPGEYVALWLRDAGEVPGTARWRERYDAWLDWFAAGGVAAIGMGLVTVWRTDSADPVVVLEDVPQPVEQPVGALLPDWIARRRWLAAQGDAALLAHRLRAVDGVVRTRDDLLGPAGWTTAAARLRQSHGMRWEVEVDEAIAAVVAGCDGRAPLRDVLQVLAAGLGAAADDVAEAALPVVRDLIGRGYLVPSEDR